MTNRGYIGCCIALCLIFGCRKSGKSPIIYNEQIPIVLGTTLDIEEETRSSGPVESWNGEDLYLYGVARTADGKHDLGNLLLKQVRTTAPEGSTIGTIRILKDNGEHYLYGDGNYDFFGYSVDDAKLEPKEGRIDEQTQTISMDVSIDGRQDIMMAWANRKQDCKDLVNPENAYSKTSARHNVHPHLTFKHQLSWFSLYVRAVPEEGGHKAPEITVVAVSVETRARAHMNVVRPDPSEYNEKSAFVPIGEKMRLKVDEKKSNTEISEWLWQGEIMVMPDEPQYIVYLEIEQKGFTNVDNKPFTRKVKIDFSADAKEGIAARGAKYEIILTLWGLERVSTNISMVKWDDSHGAFDLDTEGQMAGDNN